MPAMSDLGPRRYRIVNGVASPIETGHQWPVSRIARVIILVLCWVYAATLLGFYAAASFSSAEFWPVHLVLYGPRWIAALPAILLVPLAAWLRVRWSMLPLGVALMSFLGFWEFNVPWENLLTTSGESGQTLRVLTCNVQGRDLKIQVLKKCRVSGRRHFCHPTSFQGGGCENGRSTEDPASGS